MGASCQQQLAHIKYMCVSAWSTCTPSIRMHHASCLAVQDILQCPPSLSGRATGRGWYHRQFLLLLLPNRYDRWPEEGGRPAATTDGLFEISHARLVRLLATLCPQQLCQALQQPLTQRLQQYTAPSGPSEKAEVAAVAETLAGLLAAAAPVAAGSSSSSSSWAISLLKDALGSSTLDMSDAWSAAVWYVVDHLLDAVTAAGGSSSTSGGNDAAGAAAMEVEELGGAAALPAAVMLQQVLSTVLAAVPGAGAAAGQQQGGGSAASASPGGVLTSDVKRLKYLLSCLPPVRRMGVLGTTGTNLIAAAADSPDTSGQPSAAALEAAAAVSRHPAGYVASSEGVSNKSRLPKSARVFLAAVMHELQGLLEVEQPTAMREAIGSLLADLAGVFSAPEPIMLPPEAAAATRASNGGSSGCSSPAEIEVPAAGAAAQGLEGSNGDSSLAPEVLLLNSSISGLKSQAAKLLQQSVSRFATHAAFLETLKSSGSSTTPSGSSSNLAAAGGSGAATPPYRSSDASDDVVMVEAPEASGSGGPAGLGSVSAGLGSYRTGAGGSPSTANLPALAKSLTQCGIGLQMIIAMVDSGESATLRPLLSALLPGVLALQELSGPGVQQLASEAKAAFVLYKYLPFGPAYVDGVGRLILGSGGSDAWSTRAAALVFLQVFWFRHCYLLAQQDMEQLQAFVVGRLQDPKVEVRSLSAATLSGIIKALPAHENDILRQQIISQVDKLFATSAKGRNGSKRRAVAGPVAAAASVSGVAAPAQQQQGAMFLSEAQAVVQGLKAFVLSSPYDVPDWMPEVLMALVGAANSRNPLVRRDASKALSEFKRTHEEDALDQLKGMLAEEQWEALTQVTSSASYFV
eukprot:GHUV01009325.1.p1 GENE.GHUV01009325.1~~GHUV01009325.1.p1  ORF type:complete len:859 (+),score=405.44 GHUV01009325.1:948-3524(+)